MMLGNHVNKKLSAYCLGELPEEEARRVAEHLSACGQCRDEYEQIKFGVQLASQLSRESAPVSLWNEIEAALERPQPKSLWAISPLQFAAVSVAALLLIGSIGFWIYSRRTPQNPNLVRTDQQAWEVTRIEGLPIIDGRKVVEKDQMKIDEVLETDRESQAEVRNSRIGEVVLEPNSRLRLIQSGDAQHRIALDRGKILAAIWSPPGTFLVDTPSARAIDLGCVYTLEVNDDGQGLLHVQSGIVAFENKGRESFVPEDAMCVTRPVLGPGTPYFNDATASFRDALAKFDTAQDDGASRAKALKIVLNRARQRDALTLWHLLTRTNGAERDLVFDRLARLVPTPAGVTRKGILQGERRMLDAWGGEVGLVDLPFWRQWKQSLPSQTDQITK